MEKIKEIALIPVTFMHWDSKKDNTIWMTPKDYEQIIEEAKKRAKQI